MIDKVIWYLEIKLNFVDKIMFKLELLVFYFFNTMVNVGETVFF